MEIDLKLPGATCQKFEVIHADAGVGIPSQIQVNLEHYISRASKMADEAKIEYRAILKENQFAKAELAKAIGCPLSARQKERERSRRESAVTRKRAEVYLSELERLARVVPLLEKEINSLRGINASLLRECTLSREDMQLGGSV